MRRLAALVLLALAAVLVLRRRLARRAALPASPAAAPVLPPAPRFLSVPWTLVDAPADEPALAIRADLSARLALDRVDVRETPTQVFVTVIARARREAAGDAERADGEARVALSRPLGERELIHAPADAPDAAPAPHVYP